jgi:hypothetical protein
MAQNTPLTNEHVLASYGLVELVDPVTGMKYQAPKDSLTPKSIDQQIANLQKLKDRQQPTEETPDEPAR